MYIQTLRKLTLYIWCNWPQINVYACMHFWCLQWADVFAYLSISWDGPWCKGPFILWKCLNTLNCLQCTWIDTYYCRLCTVVLYSIRQWVIVTINWLDENNHAFLYWCLEYCVWIHLFLKALPSLYAFHHSFTSYIIMYYTGVCLKSSSI